MESEDGINSSSENSVPSTEFVNPGQNINLRLPGRRTEFVLPPGRRTGLEDGGEDGARTEYDGDRTELIPSSRTEDGARSVLQDGGRSSRTEDGTEADSQTPVLNLFRPQTPSSRTEDGAPGRRTGRGPIIRPQY